MSTEKMSAEKRNLIAVFSLVALAAGGGIIILLAGGYVVKEQIGFEVVKALTQFLLVGVLGVFISLLVQNYNRKRDEQIVENNRKRDEKVQENNRKRDKEILINDLRKAVLTDLITAYSDTKKARRIIMGNRLSGGIIPYEVYDEQIKNIIATQLALELLNNQIITFEIYFGDNAGSITKNVERMEKYLGEIIDEYKDALKEKTEIPQILELGDLRKLSFSMGRENEEGNFKEKFADLYKEAVKEIRRQVLT